MSIEAVTFDLDETLLRYTESPDAVLERCFEHAGHDPFFTFEEYLTVIDRYIEDSTSPLELRTNAFSALAREAGCGPAAGRDVAAMWGEAHAEAEVELYPGAIGVIEACAESFEVGLITNGPSEAQIPKMETTGLTDRFDVEVYAADDLRFKPDPAPFEQALDALTASPDATVHVGDSFQADIEGAIDVGMQAVWIENDTEQPDHVSVPRIRSIDELLDLSDFTRVLN